LCEKARDCLASMKGGWAAIAAAKTQIEALQQAIAAYQLSVGNLPTAAQGLEALRHPPADLPNPSKWDGPYLQKEVPLDPWNNPYRYMAPGAHNPDSFDVWSFGPDGMHGTDDDIGTWAQSPR
jgi:general secretion pathway protein G